MATTLWGEASPVSGMLATTLFEPGSIRWISRLSRLVAHTAPAPTLTSSGPGPMATRALGSPVRALVDPKELL